MPDWPDTVLGDIAQGLAIDDLLGNTFWFDKQTHAVIMLSYDPERDWEGDLLDEDSPDWQKKDREQGKAMLAAPERYLPIRGRGTPDRLRAFLYSVDDPELHDALHAAKRGGRGAYRRVREELERRGEEQLWYDFQEEADREMALEWLEAHGLTPPGKPCSQSITASLEPSPPEPEGVDKPGGSNLH